MKRNLQDVLSLILDEIPNHKTELISSLRKLIQSLNYSAPEQETENWNKAAIILSSYTSPEEEYVEKIKKIFNGH